MALSAALVHQLNKLARVSLADVPLVPLPRALDALDPRMCQQRSEQWFHQRRGHLTASRFHHALGFGSPLQRREALNALRGDAHQEAAFASDAFTVCQNGSAWGHQFERSALATYLTAFVLPRSAGARLHETGFWPCAPHPSGLLIGASPDALLEDDNDVFGAGGVVLEVKCPYGGGVPRAQGRVHARQMPQLQGAMLATGRSQCHLVTWSPSGAAIYAVLADTMFQEAMVETMATAASAAREERQLTPTERVQAAQVRLWSRQLASDATMLTTIDAHRCVMLQPEDEAGSAQAASTAAVL